MAAAIATQNAMALAVGSNPASMNIFSISYTHQNGTNPAATLKNENRRDAVIFARQRVA